MITKRINETSGILYVEYPDKNLQIVFFAENKESLIHHSNKIIRRECFRLIKRFVRHRIIALKKANISADSNELLTKIIAAENLLFHLDNKSTNNPKEAYNLIKIKKDLIICLLSKNRPSAWNHIIPKFFNFLNKN